MTTRSTTSAIVAGLVSLVFCCASRTPAADESQRDKRVSDEATFEAPEPWVLKERATRGGPGGTDWDNHYRSLIQTSARAESKGFPSHQEAVKLIVADARKNSRNLDKHLYWTLFIKHFSSKYRPPEGTASLRKLYTALLDIKYGTDTALDVAEASSDSDGPFAARKDVTIHRDVVYGKAEPTLQNLDAYIVDRENASPVLIEIHGGGWRRGRKSSFSSYPEGLFERLFDEGISVVSINYRMIPKYPFPASEHDVVRAVQFVRSKAEEWNIDPDRIAAMGGSAGAHLSLWVGLHDDFARPDATDAIARQSSRLTCIVDFAGPVDMTRFDPQTMRRMGARGEDMSEIFPAKFGYDLTRPKDQQDRAVLEAMKQCSPINFVSAGDPPVFVSHQAPRRIDSTTHPPVPATINDPHSYWHGILLADALDKAGVTVHRHIGPDVGRGRTDTARVAGFIIDHLCEKAETDSLQLE
jgi:acetyl esterase/lipase